MDKTIKVTPKPRNVYIKDGKRIMQSSDGVMHIPADQSRKMFGKMKGGKYSQLQVI